MRRDGRGSSAKHGNIRKITWRIKAERYQSQRAHPFDMLQEENENLLDKVRCLLYKKKLSAPKSIVMERLAVADGAIKEMRNGGETKVLVDSLTMPILPMKGANKDSRYKEQELGYLAVGSRITTDDPKIGESKSPVADEVGHLRYVYFPFLILAQVLLPSTRLGLLRWNERGFTVCTTVKHGGLEGCSCQLRKLP
ncbi:uncharacterized protein LOC116254975 [Nymphaea colorata]|nr:uncharacterized protein LOC116254975 [Nymphaea colorata]